MCKPNVHGWTAAWTSGSDSHLWAQSDAMSFVLQVDMSVGRASLLLPSCWVMLILTAPSCTGQGTVGSRGNASLIQTWSVITGGQSLYRQWKKQGQDHEMITRADWGPGVMFLSVGVEEKLVSWSQTLEELQAGSGFRNDTRTGGKPSDSALFPDNYQKTSRCAAFDFVFMLDVPPSQSHLLTQNTSVSSVIVSFGFVEPT